MEETVANLSGCLKTKDIRKHDHQTIYYCNLDSNETNANTSVLVSGNDVTIIPSSGEHSNGSSKVKLKNVVDYTWEYKFYPGQILAIHISGEYIAYGIQAKDLGVIRVFNMRTSERGIIKGISGMTQDVAFAFIKSPILLACIDSIGDVFVYAVKENAMKAVECSLMLQIRNEPSHSNNVINRIVWCPYVPDEDANEDDDSSKLIVTRGNKVHLWTVNLIRAVHGQNVPIVTPETAGDGFLEIVDDHDIVDVAFSPDGSTIALACSDGGIRFFQADVEEGNSPLCIHDWRPHNDNPVSCLYFLDNHLDSDSHFWKYAVTGINGNSEIKIWSCESWSCLQTIKYFSNDSSSESKLKVCVDITANYIFISDMEKRLLYVLQLKKDKDETEIRVHVISEFLLPCPILSFGVITAKRDYFADDAWISFDTSTLCKDDSRDMPAEDEMDDSTSLKTMIKLYLVQPKALHECIIFYDSEDVTTKFNERTNFIDYGYTGSKNIGVVNGLGEKSKKHSQPEHSSRVVDLSCIMKSIKKKPNEKYLPVSVIESMHLPSPVEEHDSDSRMNNGLTRLSADRESISCRLTNAQMNGSQESDDDISTVDRIEENGKLVSIGSSPSREVQDILFASEKADENDTEQLTENTESDPPATIWPKIPVVAGPENICANMTNIMQTNSTEQVRSRSENNESTSQANNSNKEMVTPVPVVLDKSAIIETRINQMQESLKIQQNDIKQSLNALHQYLLVHRDEEKKQKHVRNDEGLDENRIVNTITQNVNSMISSEVEYIIKQEISGNVLPSLKSTMDNLGQQLHLKMSQHLNLAEQQLREHIVKTVHKKSVTDSFASAVGNTVPSVVSEAFNDIFCNVILPKFEKSCQEMFNQVNNLFIDGTREFLNLMTNHIRLYEDKQTTLLQAKIDEIAMQLREATQVSSMNAIKSLQPELLKSLQHDLEEHRLQLESCIINISKASPTSFLNVAQKQQAQQEHIEYLIAQGKIDVAVEHALSASDLKLLICLCEKLDPDKVFAEPCIIQQHILLSFIQQLSVDLNIQTDLKHRFIEGAVMCLDKKHPICEKNFPKILPAVRSRILQYINANPNNKNTRNMKILLMAVESLLNDKNEQFPG